MQHQALALNIRKFLPNGTIQTKNLLLFLLLAAVRKLDGYVHWDITLYQVMEDDWRLRREVVLDNLRRLIPDSMRHCTIP